MDVENALEAEDKINAFIKLEGNYFIMDSEQLVSNPFQELQQEAVSEAQQKRANCSMTERLTSVKNNVCENHFLMARSRLERQEMGRLKQLHDNTNKLRHEVKLMDLDRQRHKMEVKKRLEPERDFSYDDTQLTNMEKRLGANIASFYLEKKLKYPARLRSVSDISVTPTVRKARASLRFQDLQRSLDERPQTSKQERALTAKSVSTTLTAPSSLARRRGSRSAPLFVRSRVSGNEKTNSNALPVISQVARDNFSAPCKDNENAGSGNKRGPSLPPQHVKFAFDNPLKILASSEESAKLFERSYTYYPGMTRALHHGGGSSAWGESSDEEDDALLPDYIDLRSLFFGGDSGDIQSQYGHNRGQPNPEYLLALRKSQHGPPPKLTTDMMQVEADYINAKVNRFIEKLNEPRGKDDGSDDDEDVPALPYMNPAHATPRLVASRGVTTSTGTNTKGTTTQEGRANTSNLISSNTKSTSTTDLLASQQTPVAAPNTANTEDTDHDDGDRDTEAGKSPRGKTKYSWKYIKGREANGTLKGNYTPEDLVLQSLTGVPIRNALTTHVPLHSASRAMRHTATFKMHKIVERLINERTKYERHQVEELKKQMEGGGDGTGDQPGGSDKLNRKVSSTTITTHSSGRKISVV